METTRDIVSVSFDRFPAPKGAATHISAFASALGRHFGRVQLVTVAPAPSTSTWIADGVTHHPLPIDGATLFERVVDFQTQLWVWWKAKFGSHQRRPKVAHIRSIYEGFSIACHKDAWCERLIYEVNALPSIELKYHYPAVADDRELMRKLRTQEQVCLAAADRIIVVSDVTRRHLVSRGVDADRIELIRNGVELDLFSYQAPRDWTLHPPAPEAPIRLFYSGTLAGWQGVPHAIDALSLLRRDVPATLTLVGAFRPKQRRQMEQAAFEARVLPFVKWLDPVGQAELVELHHQHDVVLAPLIRCDRNGDQGCCPLKVLEALSCGTPVIASDLEVVRELCRADEHALLVKPGSGKAIKDAVLRLINDASLSASLSLAGRRHVEQHFEWQSSQAALIQLYEGLEI